ARFICTYEEYLEKCRLKNTGKIPRKELKAVLTNMFERELDQNIELPEEPVLETSEPAHL
ncbi:MAG: hypothetical protein ACXV76_13605, partial [Halobacteriota archaeon]